MLGKLETGKPVRLGYVRDGRNATVAVTPQLGDRLRLWTIEGETPGAPLALGVDPRVRTEVLRIEGLDPCEGDNCRLPLLADAFRWNGLNLAAVDSRLGRYFGTSSGVLVLSTGDSLAGLQPGDVLRRIDGKSVATPRDAMKALQAHPAGTRVSVDYLRDHKAASTQVTVPKPFLWTLPPPPPAPPRATCAATRPRCSAGTGPAVGDPRRHGTAPRTARPGDAGAAAVTPGTARATCADRRRRGPLILRPPLLRRAPTSRRRCAR